MFIDRMPIVIYDRIRFFIAVHINTHEGNESGIVPTTSAHLNGI